MKLTKEECETSLYELKYYSNAYSNAHKSAIKEDVGKLQQLINEHFDNSVQIEEGKMFKLFKNKPLKFEELKKGMWVWDNVKKEYRKIYSCVYYNRGNYIRFGHKLLDDDWDYFEEDRFYRREVGEDE